MRRLTVTQTSVKKKKKTVKTGVKNLHVMIFFVYLFIDLDEKKELHKNISMSSMLVLKSCVYCTRLDLPLLLTSTASILVFRCFSHLLLMVGSFVSTHIHCIWLGLSLLLTSTAYGWIFRFYSLLSHLVGSFVATPIYCLCLDLLLLLTSTASG